MSRLKQPKFYFHLASAESYLVAEQVNRLFDRVPEWQPVLIGDPGDPGADEGRRAEIERRATQLDLQPLRWPPALAGEEAMLTAAWCKEIGRGVAFALAAFRQAFAGGRDLERRENVLIAAAACELHPNAVIKGAEITSNRRRLREATLAATQSGVTGVPALEIDGRVLVGERAIVQAAESLA